MARAPEQPRRDQFSGEELQSYDAVIERERNRGGVGPDGKISAYYGALLNSPTWCYHIASLGRQVRLAGDRSGTYTHADREWVDQVLCKDWGTNVVMGGHLEDALARGVRLEAIRALRAGREQDLTEDERQLTEYIRQVTQGRVTDESLAAMKKRMGQRGVVEYTTFIMFLVLTMRLIQAFTGATGPSDAEINQALEEFATGKRPLPSGVHIGAG
jgi:hypothetical protein